MVDSAPTVLVTTYHVRPGKEQALLGLLECHWPILRRLGLVTDDPPRVYRLSGLGGRAVVSEVITWRSSASLEEAQRAPEVLAIRKPMTELCEGRRLERSDAAPGCPEGGQPVTLRMAAVPQAATARTS